MGRVAVERIMHWRPDGAEDSVPAERNVWTWCPGCDSIHPFCVEVLDPSYHRADGSPRPTWEWDGNLEQPTFSPSLLVYSSVHLCTHTYSVCPGELSGGTCEQTSHLVGYRMPDGSAIAPKVHEPVPDGAVKALVHSSECTEDPPWGNCHSFLRAGVWEFLTDSAHQLAGQHVPMVPLPDRWQE